MSEDDSKYPSELAERFQVRLPAGMRDRIKAAAEANNRSMNAEIVATLEAGYRQRGGLFGLRPPEETHSFFVNLIAKALNDPKARVTVIVDDVPPEGRDRDLWVHHIQVHYDEQGAHFGTGEVTTASDGQNE